MVGAARRDRPCRRWGSGHGAAATHCKQEGDPLGARSTAGGLGPTVPWSASPYPAAGQLLASPSRGVSVQGLSAAGFPPPLPRRVFSQASLSSSERVWHGAEGLGSLGVPQVRDVEGTGVPRRLLTCSRASSRPRWAMRMRRCWGDPAAAPGETWQPSSRRAQTGCWVLPGSGNMRRAPCRTAHHSRCHCPRSRTARKPGGATAVSVGCWGTPEPSPHAPHLL